MSFKKIFKRKVGGTVVGNLLRKAAKSFNPLLGNGLMMKKEGESDEELNQRTNEIAMASAQGAVVGANVPSFFDKHKKKLFIGAGALVAVIVGIVLMKKKGGRR